MVGVMAFGFESIKKKSLLKSLQSITKKLCKQHDVDLQDIGLIVHTGTYRQNFRQEPAFAAHTYNKPLRSAAKKLVQPASTFSHLMFLMAAADPIMH